MLSGDDLTCAVDTCHLRDVAGGCWDVAEGVGSCGPAWCGSGPAVGDQWWPGMGNMV